MDFICVDIHHNFRKMSDHAKYTLECNYREEIEDVNRHYMRAIRSEKEHWGTVIADLEYQHEIEMGRIRNGPSHRVHDAKERHAHELYVNRRKCDHIIEEHKKKCRDRIEDIERKLERLTGVKSKQAPVLCSVCSNKV